MGLQDKQGYLVTLYLAFTVYDWVSAVPSHRANVRFRTWLRVVGHAAVTGKMPLPRGVTFVRETPFYPLGVNRTR